MYKLRILSDIKYLVFRHKIMLDCWNINPQDRPSFTDLAEYLGDFLKDNSKSVSKKWFKCLMLIY